MTFEPFSLSSASALSAKETPSLSQGLLQKQSGSFLSRILARAEVGAGPLLRWFWKGFVKSRCCRE